MNIFENIYNLIRSFFNYLSFKRKPSYDKLNYNDIESQEDYEFIILNDNNMSR